MADRTFGAAAKRADRANKDAKNAGKGGGFWGRSSLKAKDTTVVGFFGRSTAKGRERANARSGFIGG